MKKKIPKSVDDYIASAPEWARGTLQELRRTIKSAAPEAKESISYRMPYYNQDGRLAYFGAHKNHCSFHWISAEDKKTFAKELASQTVVGSTLRIIRGEKVPTTIIQKIVKQRIKNNISKK
jgi:uncharacterized protein YdhG (YjbR/CyaY superfamily)